MNTYFNDHNMILQLCSIISMVMSAVLFGATFVDALQITKNGEPDKDIHTTVRIVFMVMFLGSIQGVI